MLNAIQFFYSQLTNKHDDRDQVVILFQDMHEVVMRDIMEDQLNYPSEVLPLINTYFTLY